MAKHIRVNLPIDQPKETLTLCDDIIEQNTALGAGTVLTGFVDMAAFALKVADAKTKHKNGDKKTQQAQKNFLRAAKQCGLAKGQTRDTEDTLQWFVLQIRDILSGLNRGTEEDLSEYGYNVVISQTGARRNVSIDIPRTPQGMVDLAKDIIEQHDTLAADSPLSAALVDMGAFEAMTEEAEALMEEWNGARAQAQVLHGQARVIMGYDAGQTSNTDGTLYFDIIGIRNRLLQKHQGTEEDLSDYGFDVVISSKSNKKGDTRIVLELTVLMGQTGDFQINKISTADEAVLIDFESIGSDGRFFASDNTNGVPGVGPVLQVTSGQKKTKTPLEVTTELGIGDAKPFLKVENSGITPGTYRVTFHF